MKQALTNSLILVLVLLSMPAVNAQRTKPPFVIGKIEYDQAVPGQIVNLLVDGLGEPDNDLSLPIKDFVVSVSQDGVTLKAPARSASAITLFAYPKEGSGPPARHPYFSVGFVLPKGVHPGEVALQVSYKNQQTPVAKLVVADHPMRPTIAIVTLQMVSVALSAGDKIGTSGPPQMRLERGTKTRFFVTPLVDPADPNVGIQVQFKQGETLLDARAQVVHQSEGAVSEGNMVAYYPDNDYLEVEIPAGLRMGPAEVMVRLRAGGKLSETATEKVEITDANRATESPRTHAPQLISISPRKVGAGQPLALSIAHARGLDPDPSKTLVIVEQGNARYLVQPETNNVGSIPEFDRADTAFLIVRPTRQIIGAAKVRAFNLLRDEALGSSEAIDVEILDAVLAPEIIDVREATAAELETLRKLYEFQSQAGRAFPEYDPNERYLQIRANGLDFDSSHVRIRLQQEGFSATLSPADFSLHKGDQLIVRLPKGFHPGSLTLFAENRGADTFSKAVSKDFKLGQGR